MKYMLQILPGDFTNSAVPGCLLKPFDARVMRCYPASERVNRAENDASCDVDEVE
jgi:hypothetical protein